MKSKETKIEESSNPLFNRRLLASKTNTITLCKDGIDANYYNVEEQFEISKQLVNPKISSLILLERFIEAVKREELEPFNLILIDLDGVQYDAYVDEYGAIVEVYAGSIKRSKIVIAKYTHKMFYKLSNKYDINDSIVDSYEEFCRTIN